MSCKEDEKRKKDHIKGTENNLLIENDLQIIISRNFSIKTQVISIKSHYDRIEWGFYNLPKCNITPFLVTLKWYKDALMNSEMQSFRMDMNQGSNRGGLIPAFTNFQS